MKSIKLVFGISKGGNSIVTHIESPNNKEFIDYAKKLEDWNGIFVSFYDGEVSSLRDVILNTLPE
jgi:hypothetical protein